MWSRSSFCQQTSRKASFSAFSVNLLDFVLQIQTYSSKLGKNFGVLSAKWSFTEMSNCNYSPVKIMCFGGLSSTQTGLFQKGNLHWMYELSQANQFSMKNRILKVNSTINSALIRIFIRSIKNVTKLSFQVIVSENIQNL